MGPAGTARGAADVRGTADVRMDTGAVVRIDTGAVVQKSGIVVTVTVTVTLVKTAQKTMSATNFKIPRKGDDDQVTDLDEERC